MGGSDCNQDRNFSSLIVGLNTWKTAAHSNRLPGMTLVSSAEENVVLSSSLPVSAKEVCILY